MAQRFKPSSVPKKVFSQTLEKIFFLKRFGHEKGMRIWNRFEVYYTPVHGSWLNQAEITITMYSSSASEKVALQR